MIFSLFISQVLRVVQVRAEAPRLGVSALSGRVELYMRKFSNESTLKSSFGFFILQNAI